MAQSDYRSNVILRDSQFKYFSKLLYRDALFILYETDGLYIRKKRKPGKNMNIIYISVIISAAIWLYFIYRYDRFEPEPILLVIAIGVAGGLMSSIPSAVLNSIAAFITGVGTIDSRPDVASAGYWGYLSFALFVGFNEEFWKAAAAVVLLKRLNEFDEPIDALIYSMTIALGFAAFENIEYTVIGGIFTLVLRSLTAVPLHIGLAAIWGSGIARAKYVNNRRYFSTLIPYVVVAAVLHAIYNYIQFVNAENPYMLLVAFAFALILLVNAAGRLKRYQKISPYRKAGVCPDCGTKNYLWSSHCSHCGRSFMAK